MTDSFPPGYGTGTWSKCDQDTPSATKKDIPWVVPCDLCCSEPFLQLLYTHWAEQVFSFFWGGWAGGARITFPVSRKSKGSRLRKKRGRRKWDSPLREHPAPASHPLLAPPSSSILSPTTVPSWSQYISFLLNHVWVAPWSCEPAGD